MTNNDLDDLGECDFDKFEKFLQGINGENLKRSVELYTYQEMLRFRSIAGTILENFKNVENCIGERNITHPLMRSLLEGWIYITYIYWENDENERQERFEEIMKGFKIDYQKLFDDPDLPRKNELPAIPVNAKWSELRKPRNAKDMLVAMKNDNGDRLDYLYFAYRIMSFDTHAKASESLFLEAFQKPCSFGFIHPDKIINLMANSYIEVIQKHLVKF